MLLYNNDFFFSAADTLHMPVFSASAYVSDLLKWTLVVLKLGCWLIPLSHESISEFSHWCWSIMTLCVIVPKGVEDRARCRPVKIFHTKLGYFFMDLALFSGPPSCWNRKGPSPKAWDTPPATTAARMSVVSRHIDFQRCCCCQPYLSTSCLPLIIVINIDDDDVIFVFLHS